MIFVWDLGFQTKKNKNKKATLQKPADFCFCFFFSISKKKKKKKKRFSSSNRPIIFAPVLFFFFGLFACFFLKTWGSWKTWVNMNTWKAWMLKLEYYFDFEKRRLSHTRTKKKGGKKNDQPTLIFFICYSKQTFAFMPNQGFKGVTCNWPNLSKFPLLLRLKSQDYVAM